MTNKMNEQLLEAGVLLAVGMTVVFIFLIFLIVGIHFIAWYCRTFPSDETRQVNQSREKSDSKEPISVNPQLVKAISAAVHSYRHTTLK